jgi:Mrp family chromosome partitioning ATPase
VPEFTVLKGIEERRGEVMFESEAEPRAVPPADRTSGESGARRFGRALRERWIIVVITVVAAIAAALLYVSSTKPVYQSDAELLISPVTDPSLDVLGLIRASSTPSSDTQTAALLISRPDVAAEAARLLRSTEAPQALLDRVQAVPVAGSDVLSVTANGSTPAAAARLANAFAQAAINVRTGFLQAQLAAVIPRLQAQINQSRQGGSAPETGSLVGELAALRALQGAPDPTIQFGSPASPQPTPVSPRRALSLVAGAVLGLVVGVAMALAADALDPRLRRESQLHGALELPILARVPSLPNAGRPRPTADMDQFGSLVTTHELLADALGGDGGGSEPKRTVVFTGTEADAGCTTIALQHAWVVAAEGERVVLADGDPRYPAVGPAAGAEPSTQVEHVLAGRVTLEEALVWVEDRGVKLRVLAVQQQPDRRFRVRLPMGQGMIAELLLDADVLVVDAPPLTQSPRALVLARSADHVVVVARIGETRLAKLRELRELLSVQGVPAAGIVLIARRHRLGGRVRHRKSKEVSAFGVPRFSDGAGVDRIDVPASVDGGPVDASPTGAAAMPGDVGPQPRRLRYGERGLERQ